MGRSGGRIPLPSMRLGSLAALSIHYVAYLDIAVSPNSWHLEELL